ncbi:hypothetical protein [Janthinobacterium sp. SUN033]|uniref:hypothetical protein n=1 Tax=Janthinobacterium sp. SUN033 TaxID=3002439 RepID=UPI0025AF280A|nr:hypothetical protein [Janthinobacterium sp. SUN033]MDN2676740.1 hypothetical protein [Janthinobacterium sp. SUN033]
MKLSFNKPSLCALGLQFAFAMCQHRKLIYTFINMSNGDLQEIITQIAVTHGIKILSSFPKGMNKPQSNCSQVGIRRGHEPLQQFPLMIKSAWCERGSSMGTVRFGMTNSALHLPHGPACKHPECLNLLQLIANVSIIFVSGGFSLLGLRDPERNNDRSNGSDSLHPTGPIRRFQAVNPSEPSKSHKQNRCANDAGPFSPIHKSIQSCLKGILA